MTASTITDELHRQLTAERQVGAMLGYFRRVCWHGATKRQLRDRMRYREAKRIGRFAP